MYRRLVIAIAVLLFLPSACSDDVTSPPADDDQSLCALLAGVVLSSSLVTSCSGINLERNNWGTERSAPLDCFPETVDGDSAVAGSGETDLAAISPPFDLSGVWAQQQITSAITSAPLIGESIATSTNTLRMEIDQNGGQVTMTAQVCAITQASSSNAGRTIVPQGFVDAIGLSERTVTLVPTDTGYRFLQERYIRILGVELEDDANDPIHCGARCAGSIRDE